jgi:DNA repair exonuclease SbcCD ATPase subunit
MIPLPVGLSARLLIAAAFGACLFLVGMGVHKTFSDRKIARMEREMAEARADAAFALAEAERKARAMEAAWAQRLAEREGEYAEALKQRDHIVRDLAVAGDRLRNALAKYARDGGTATTPESAISDLRHRIETVGLLLAEADRLAEDSSRAADALRDELALCRGYVTSVAAK